MSGVRKPKDMPWEMWEKNGYHSEIEADVVAAHNEPEADFVYSRHIQMEFGENKSAPPKPLPIKTVEEVIEEAGEEIPWIIEGLLARGALTDVSGVAKDSGLKDYPDHIRIVQFKDIIAVQWNTLMHQAGAEVKRRGLDALVVDTFAVFARLKGSEENDAGPVADRMRVLRMIAQKYNIAVVLIRHAGKDGTPRGSSAFEAEADICIIISRPEGRHAPSVRRLSAKGRYGVWERNVQLDDGRFISLGADNKVEFNKAVAFIKSTLPSLPEDGMRHRQLVEQHTGSDEEITARTLSRALEWLVKQGDVGEKQLMDQRGKPKIYWLAYKPSAGVLEDESIYSRQTPSANAEKKSW
jgi:hypothetical protein